MLFAAVFFINAAGNFAFGIALSAVLGPAESGRYSTAALLAGTLSAGVFEWLRQSSLRFSGDHEGRADVAASLDLGYLLVMGLLFVAAGIAAASGYSFGLSTGIFMLTPLLAVGLSRVDFAGAVLRARDKAAPFAWLYGLRQLLAFGVVLIVAWRTHDATLTIAALTLCSILPALALSGQLRTPGAALSLASRRRLSEFFFYAKPIVVALVLYQLVILINRKVALTTLGAEATGQLSLASDLVQRLFFAMNTVPELLLFQYALKRDREEGQAAAKQQIGVNMVLSLALLAPMMAGFIAMMPTFETLLVPSAFHGEFARLGVEFAPGFLAFCVISSALNPVFQLGRTTWPVTIAALAALVVDLGLLAFAPAPLDRLVGRIDLDQSRRRASRSWPDRVPRPRLPAALARCRHRCGGLAGDGVRHSSAQRTGFPRARRAMRGLAGRDALWRPAAGPRCRRIAPPARDRLEIARRGIRRLRRLKAAC